MVGSYYDLPLYGFMLLCFTLVICALYLKNEAPDVVDTLLCWPWNLNI